LGAGIGGDLGLLGEDSMARACPAGGNGSGGAGEDAIDANPSILHKRTKLNIGSIHYSSENTHKP